LIIPTQNCQGEAIEESDTDGACTVHERGKKCMQSVYHKIRNYVEDQGVEGTVRITIVREEVARRGLDSRGSGYGPVMASFIRHDTSGFVIGEHFLGPLIEC
jgi:hypothetical protein